MARIIETSTNGRRIVQLSSDDVISVITEYQRIVSRGASYLELRESLENNVIYIPEDV